jgi:hypothetical protein
MPEPNRPRPVARLLQPPPPPGVLAEMAGLLCLRPQQAMLIGSSRIFPAPGGVAWRLQFDDLPARARSKPCVLLPLHAEQLTGAAVARLLEAQQRLMAEQAVYAGVSPEGWLQLSTLHWYERARDLLETLQRTLREAGLLMAQLRAASRAAPACLPAGSPEPRRLAHRA